MKVLLASLAFEKESGYVYSPNAPYSLGLAYIFSALEQDEHNVKLLYLNGYDYETSDRIFYDNIEEFGPDVIGLQIFSMNKTQSFRAIEKIHDLYPNIRIIIGGVHTSVLYEQIVERYSYIIAVVGEGEKTMVEIVNAYQANSEIKNIPGVAYSNGSTIILVPKREVNRKLDELPFPKHEVFFDNEPDRTTAHLITSRGCPARCSFCCVNIIARTVRKRSVDCVIEEIKYLKKRYPRINMIHFQDDAFFTYNERVIELCKKIINSNIKLNFMCSARVKPVSREMFEWLEKAGFTKIMFGLETGSEKILKSINKKIKGQDVIDLFKILKDFKFIVTTFLMCGFPGETHETISETIDLVNRMQRIHYSWIAGVGKLQVLPGTEVYSIMKASGGITDDYWLTEKPIPLYTIDYTFAELVQMEERMMNAVSFERIITYKGFKNHFMKMPLQIIRFSCENPKLFAHIVLGKIKREINSKLFAKFGLAFERRGGKLALVKRSE